jgi:peptidoglycan L-alanyl-D-glutamate endopeptidase CwlK
VASRSLEDLEAATARKARCLIAAAQIAGIDLLVTCTLRTHAEQAALYAQGRTKPGKRVTNAQPGSSAHNFGLALDVVPMNNGKPIWDAKHPVWPIVGKLGEDCGLEWGGKFKKGGLIDMPHFQEPEWRRLVM